MSQADSSQHTIWAHSDIFRILKLFASAALFIAGMFLGRFLTKTEMQEVAAAWEAKLSTLQAELAVMRQQAAQPSPHQKELDRLREQYQQLVERSSNQASRIAAQSGVIERALAAAAADRRACLEQLRCYEDAGQTLAADKVLKFADELYERQHEVLASLTADSPSASPASPSAPLPADTHASESTLQDRIRASDPEGASSISGRESIAHRSPVSTTDRAARPETADREATDVADGSNQKPQTEGQSTKSNPDAGFFDPQPKRPSGFTFITPRRSSRVASAKRSGITFASESPSADGPVLR